jgi:hypothetical protein
MSANLGTKGPVRDPDSCCNEPVTRAVRRPLIPIRHLSFATTEEADRKGLLLYLLIASFSCCDQLLVHGIYLKLRNHLLYLFLEKYCQNLGRFSMPT